MAKLCTTGLAVESPMMPRQLVDWVDLVAWYDEEVPFVTSRPLTLADVENASNHREPDVVKFQSNHQYMESKLVCYTL